MCHKIRRLGDLHIRRVYVYSIYIYYVYLEVYVNLNVEFVKSFKFPIILTCECNDVCKEASLSFQRGQWCCLRLGCHLIYESNL